MKNKNIFIVLFTLISSVSFAQSEFLNTYGLPASGVETVFNDVAFHGTTDSYYAVGNINERGIIMRVDANGNQVWNKILIPEGSFYSVTFNPITDEIMAVGLDETQSPSRIIYVHIDMDGTLLDVPRYYQIPNSQRVVRPRIMLSTVSPATFMVSFSNVPSDARTDYFDNLGLMRIHANGDVIWSYEYFTDRTQNDDQMYDLVENIDGGCWYTGFTSQESNHSYIGRIDINGIAFGARRMVSEKEFTRFLSIDRFGDQIVLGGESAGDYTGRGIVATINTRNNNGWLREYPKAQTTVSDVKFLSNAKMIAKRAGVNGDSSMDLMVLTEDGGTINGLRYDNISNNFFAGIDRMSNDKALVYNTSANLPNSIGSLDNFIDVFNTSNLSAAASCISSVISATAPEVRYNIEYFNMRRGNLEVLVTQRTKEAWQALIQKEVCCNCTTLDACFTKCDINCLDCADVFINCSTPSDCGNFNDVENPYTWVATNTATGAIITSNERDFLFIPPATTNANYEICLTVTDSEGCVDKHCDVINYNCNSTLTEETETIDLGVVPSAKPIEVFSGNKYYEIKFKQQYKVELQPNPAQSEVTLNLGSEDFVGGEVLFYDATGKLSLQENINSTEKQTINIRHLPAGIYILKITKNGKNIENQKLIIHH